jgi:hypothetical protein
MIHSGRQFGNHFYASRYHKIRKLLGCVSLTQSQITNFKRREITGPKT